MPFAYDLSYYRNEPDDHDLSLLCCIFPRLIDLYRYLLKRYPTPLNKDRLVIRGWYDDTTTYPRDVCILDFVQRHELDLVAIRNEVRKAIDKELTEVAEMKASGKAPFSGQCWLSDIGEDTLVENVIKAQQYSWLPVDQIDWAAIEAKLIRE